MINILKKKYIVQLSILFFFSENKIIERPSEVEK